MTITESLIEKASEIIKDFVLYAFGIDFEILRAILFFFSLIYSLNLILLWIYYEMKNNDEIGFWMKLKKVYNLYKASKEKVTDYNEIKKTYLEDNKEGLIALKNYLNKILEIIGYQGNNLIEKIETIPTEYLPNKENLKKSVKIIELIEKKDKFSLTKEEVDLVYSEIERALYYLDIIEKEDFLVKTLE